MRARSLGPPSSVSSHPRSAALGWVCIALVLAVTCAWTHLANHEHALANAADVLGLYDKLKGDPECAEWLGKLRDKGVTEDEIRAFAKDLGVRLQGRDLTRENFDGEMLDALAKVGLEAEHREVTAAILEVARESGLGDPWEVLAEERIPGSLRPLRDVVMRELLSGTAGGGTGFAAPLTEKLPQGTERKWFGLLVRPGATAASFSIDPKVLALGYASGRSRFDFTPYTGSGHAPESSEIWQWEVVFPAGALQAKISSQPSWTVDVVLGDLSLSFPASSFFGVADRGPGGSVKLKVRSLPSLAAPEGGAEWAALVPVGRSYQLELTATDLSQAPQTSLAPRTSGPWRVEVKVPPGYTADPDLLGVYADRCDGGLRYLGGMYDARAGAVVASLQEVPARLTLAEYKVEFRDVVGHWAEPFIRRMAARHVAKGTGEGMFDPDASVSRAQASALVQRALALPEEPRYSVVYQDVPVESWYSGAVGALARRGAIADAPSGAFRPDEPMTREGLVTLLLGAAKWEGSISGTADLLGKECALLEKFSDRGSVSPWAREAMARAVELGLIVGRGGCMIEPQSPVTRAEAVTVLWRLLGLLESAR